MTHIWTWCCSTSCLFSPKNTHLLCGTPLRYLTFYSGAKSPFPYKTVQNSCKISSNHWIILILLSTERIFFLLTTNSWWFFWQRNSLCSSSDVSFSQMKISCENKWFFDSEGDFFNLPSIQQKTCVVTKRPFGVLVWLTPFQFTPWFTPNGLS